MSQKPLSAQKGSAFPDKLHVLEAFRGRFEARRVQSEKVDIYFASYPAGTHIKEHSHDTDNYGVITQGALYLTVNGKEEKHGVGSWYHVPEGTPHSACFTEDSAEIELWFKQ